MEIILDKVFAEDVQRGLTAENKFLSSKYFYNETGDRLFQQIMEMGDYYLTRAEHEIFSQHKGHLLEIFSGDNEEFHIIELGAGDGYKTKILLRHFLQNNIDFKYLPIDISGNVLKSLENDLHKNIAGIKTEPIQGDYFEALGKLQLTDHARKIVFFLGSNIGNFNEKGAIAFLRHVVGYLNPDDLLLIGFDLKKDPATILKAYNDEAGITRQFNLNLLRRINEELDADFDLSSFAHYPVYNPETGECKSYLVSTRNQFVRIRAINKIIPFAAWETIHTEVSQKYSMEDIETMATASGCEILANFMDSKRYFVDSVWRVDALQSNFK